MTAATLPAAGGKPLLGRLASLLPARSGSGKGRIGALLAKARAHLPTAAALAAADLGGFEVFHHGGWFFVAGSILVMHFAVSD